MKYYSETLQKVYDSVEDLEKAENSYSEKVKKAQAEKVAYLEEKTKLQNEVDTAWELYVKKKAEYREFLQKHSTYTQLTLNDFLESFL